MKQYISENFKALFTEKLLTWVEAGLKDPAHMEQITPSEMMIKNAFAEANVDINFLCSRRTLNSGISEGKLAGVFLFRFCRNRFLHLSYPLSEDVDYLTLQEAAVINTIFEILQIDIGPSGVARNMGQPRIPGTRRLLQNIINELLYLMTSRHPNQEALALFFDTICHLDYALRSQVAPQGGAAHAPQPVGNNG